MLILALYTVHAQNGLCDTTYWNHTYSNNRLRIYDSRVTIRATVKIYITPDGILGIGGTGDGDYHIYVQPDTQYTWMLNYRDTNYTKYCAGVDSQGYEICTTCLNVEEICKGAITDTGPEGQIENDACSNFNDTVYLPIIGEYVEATGPFVYDTVHCWNEMHLISRMVLITTPTAINEPAASFAESLNIFPQPASKNVAFRFNEAPHAVTLIKFYTIRGQQIFICGMSETNQLNLDVSIWPAGDYLYSIVSQEQGKVLKAVSLV